MNSKNKTSSKLVHWSRESQMAINLFATNYFQLIGNRSPQNLKLCVMTPTKVRLNYCLTFRRPKVSLEASTWWRLVVDFIRVVTQMKQQISQVIEQRDPQLMRWAAENAWSRTANWKFTSINKHQHSMIFRTELEILYQINLRGNLK